jgi:hypothetical protein
LNSTATFINLCKQYTQFKLKGVGFVSVPRAVGGTDPSQIWIYLDLQDEPNFNYASMAELQGSKIIPIKHKTTIKFTAGGINNDFKIWRDCASIQEQTGLVIRLHSSSVPNQSKFWQFQIAFYIDFRGFKNPSVETREAPESAQLVEIGNTGKKAEDKASQ